MASQISDWALIFSDYLDAFGFENAGIAWGLAHTDGLNREDHKTIIDVLTKEYTQ